MARSFEPIRSQRFRREMRLRHQLEFQRVYEGKFFAADDVLVVNGLPNEIEPGVTRLGLSVSKAVGNAVVRNRWKRWIREAFRRQYAELPVGMDLIVRPKRGTRADFQRVYASLPRLLPWWLVEPERNSHESPDLAIL